MIEITRISAEEAASRRSSTTALDGGSSGSPWDRWSYFPGPASRILQCDSRTLLTTLRSADGEQRRWQNPLEALAWLGEQSTEPPVAGPPFKGGWIGNLSYDLGRLFETIPSRAIDDLNLPLFTFRYHDRVVAIDHSTGECFECRVSPQLDARPIKVGSRYGEADDAPVSDFTRPAYEAAVRRTIDYIGAGDIFQVNLAQRFTAGLPSAPAKLYEDLRRRFPAWFGAFLDFGDHALLSNSPELFVRVTPATDGRRAIVTRPIKGTRPRGIGMDAELRASLKDQAELNMIIDLERNDLGRICEIGSVRVTEPRVIEPHPTVFHGASTIEGVLRDDVRFVDLLRATFPGGSVTGAPKLRAMEIIEALEPVRRGPYCGAIGYLSTDGHIQFNLAIRTMVARTDRVYISVGGGIVADSRPAAEYDETIVKAKAMFEAVSSRGRAFGK